MTLSEYVARIMNERGISSNEVSRRSGYKIESSYVNKIRNGSIKSVPSAEKLQALAKGLGTPEDEIFKIVRGIDLERADLANSQLRSIDAAYETMTKSQRKKADYLIDLVYREISIFRTIA